MHKNYGKTLLAALVLLIALFSPEIHAQQGILFKSNPYPDHYFLTPSGLRAETGKRSLQNTSLLFFQSNNTKSNGRSLGWGFVPTFLTGGTTDIPIWLTAAKRWQTHNPKINPWIGAFFLKLPKDAENDAWIFHGGVTFGSPDKQLSVGALAGSFEKHTLPFKGAMLNGQVRLSPKTWLVCENHLLLRPNSVEPLCLWGFRSKTRTVAFELGMGWTKTRSIDTEFYHQNSRYVAFPWFSAVIGLHKRPVILDNLEEDGGQ